MCYEYDQLFWKAREAEQARRKQAEELKQRGKSPAPAKPAQSDQGAKEREPVPA